MADSVRAPYPGCGDAAVRGSIPLRSSKDFESRKVGVTNFVSISYAYFTYVLHWKKAIGKGAVSTGTTTLNECAVLYLVSMHTCISDVKD